MVSKKRMTVIFLCTLIHSGGAGGGHYNECDEIYNDFLTSNDVEIDEHDYGSVIFSQYR